MDQFDRSPEDVSFDLDAEEFSLESILDEYKDFQTDAPAPRPQPAYRSRPVTAEMIEEEEAEDAPAPRPQPAYRSRTKTTTSSAISRSASATTRPRKKSKSGTRRRPMPSVWPRKAFRG